MFDSLESQFPGRRIEQPEISPCSQAIEHVDIRKSLPAVEDCGTNELIELTCIVGLEREQIDKRNLGAKRAESARVTCLKRV